MECDDILDRYQRQTKRNNNRNSNTYSYDDINNYTYLGECSAQCE